MRNLKRALSLALASVMLLGMMVVGTSAAGYPDVDAQDNLEAIEVMQLLGVMAGDENGKFNPDKNVTRNEMAVIMTHLLKLNVGGTTPFTDVPAWAQSYVAACYTNGVVAGTSATTFGGNDNVTATQAALMVMKALGYFNFQGEFKNDWQLAVVTQAQKIGLFDGITASVNAPLTRNEVAQLCLNALEADVVVAEEQGGMSVTGDGMSVVVNPTYKYEKVVDKKNDYNEEADEVQQLVEKLFASKVKKLADNSDDFGRICSAWKYAGEEVKSAKAAEVSYTAAVKVKDIYKALSLDATISASVTVDGVPAADQEITKSGTTELGGNGVQIEVYKTENKDGTVKAVDIVMINTYFGEVAKVTPAKGDDKATVTVDGMKYETEAFEVEDKVLYTKAKVDGSFKIKTMTNAEVADSGKVTGLNTTKDTFTIGGTTYKYAANFSDSKVAVKDEVDLYLDAYGFVIGVKETKGADAQYAVVMATKSEGWDGEDSTNYAKLLLADGTIVEGKTTDKSVAYANGNLVSYTVKDGEYTIKTAQAGTNVTDITKGSAKLADGVYADSETVFVVRTGEKDDYTYTAYTGIKNVPSMDTITAGAVKAYVKDTVAKFVYVTNTDEKGTEASKPIFVLAAGKTEHVDADENTYYVYKAVVDGEVTEVSATVSDLSGLYKTVTYNSDNQITKATALEAEKQISVTGTDKAKNGLVTLGGVKYGYTDGVQVFVIDSDDDISVSSINSIQADDNDEVLVSFTNKTDNIVNAIYIFEK